jgi:hypothetical protein
MCHERRETVTVTDMGGNVPKRVWGFTLSEIVARRIVAIGGVAAATLSIVALFSMGVGFVQSTGAEEVREVIHQELQPGGIIFEAQSTAIEQHREQTEAVTQKINAEQFHYIVRRLERLQSNQDHLMQGIGVEPLRLEPIPLPTHMAAVTPTSE